MMDSLLIIEAFIFFISGLTHGIIGFGFPMIATPALSLFLSVKDSVLMTLFPTLSLNMRVVIKSGFVVDLFKQYWMLLLSISIGCYIGTHLLVVYYTEFYKILLAFMTILYLKKEILKFSFKDKIEKYPKFNMILFGLISGIVSGLVNVMIPVIIIYILELGLKKENFVGLMNLCFFSSKMTQIVVFGSLGNFSLAFFYIIIPMIAISLLGLSIGSKFRDRLDEEFYVKVLRFTLWCLSFYLIVDYFIQYS